MDTDENESNEKPTSEASKDGNDHDRSDDDDDEKIAEKDLEYLSNKTKKQWRDYERSLERPTHDSTTEDPLTSPWRTSDSEIRIAQERQHRVV